MHTCLRSRCQSGWRALLLAALWPLAALAAIPTPAPPPPPAPTPIWQPELDAVHLAQVKLLLTMTASSDEVKKRRDALGENFRQLAAKYPDAAPIQRAAGDYASFVDQPTDAMHYWQCASQLDPQDAATASALGEGFLRLGQTRAAYRSFQQAVNAAPEVALYHFSLANVLYLFRQELVSPPDLPDEGSVLNQALEHFLRAAELAPGDLHLAQAYAETFYIFAKPDWLQALVAWQKVLALSGEKTDFSNSHLARVSLRLGRPVDAEHYLANMHDPAYASLKQNLGQQVTKLLRTPRRAP